MNANDVILDKIKDLQATITALLPNSRERATMLTKVDEARLWLGEVPPTEMAESNEAFGVEHL